MTGSGVASLPNSSAFMIPWLMVKALRNKNPTPVPTRILLIDAGSSSRLKTELKKWPSLNNRQSFRKWCLLIPLLRPSPAEVKRISTKFHATHWEQQLQLKRSWDSSWNSFLTLLIGVGIQQNLPDADSQVNRRWPGFSENRIMDTQLPGFSRIE